MNISKSKKLNKNIETVCDYSGGRSKDAHYGSQGETDPTTATVTIIVTTINTHLVDQKLTI